MYLAKTCSLRLNCGRINQWYIFVSTVYFGTSAPTWKQVYGGGLPGERTESVFWGVFASREAGSGESCEPECLLSGGAFMEETLRV